MSARNPLSPQHGTTLLKEPPPWRRIYAKHDLRGMSLPGEDLIPTRRSLLSRIKNPEDQDSWKVFFDRYAPLIYGVAMKSGLSVVEAQEAVHETMITVSKKIPGFKYDPAIGSFKGWLMTITHWRIKDQLRKRMRDAAALRSSTPSTGTTMIERIADPEGSQLEKLWDEEWQKHIMEQALAKVKRKVKPRHYQIFDLCAIKNWPLQKVAQSLGVNIGQVYLARHRVGNLVRKEIKLLETKPV
jgi:RNA polymerase sigma factor (sigma-70 family)